MKSVNFSLMRSTRLDGRREREKTHQPRDGRWQPVDPLDDAGLDLVDQTARGEKERGEGEHEGEGKAKALGVVGSIGLTSEGTDRKSVAKTQCCVFTTLFNGGHLVSVLVNAGCRSLM